MKFLFLFVLFDSSSISPQSPTLADFGITKETLDRLPLLRLTVDPQNSHAFVPQWWAFLFITVLEHF